MELPSGKTFAAQFPKELDSYADELDRQTAAFEKAMIMQIAIDAGMTSTCLIFLLLAFSFL